MSLKPSLHLSLWMTQTRTAIYHLKVSQLIRAKADSEPCVQLTRVSRVSEAAATVVTARKKWIVKLTNKKIKAPPSHQTWILRNQRKQRNKNPANKKALTRFLSLKRDLWDRPTSSQQLVWSRIICDRNLSKIHSLIWSRRYRRPNCPSGWPSTRILVRCLYARRPKKIPRFPCSLQIRLPRQIFSKLTRSWSKILRPQDHLMLR